jgi:two-component system cell cycle response regulator DivK
MDNKTILIIEDNPSNLKLAKICLENQGYHVIAAEAAEEGLEILKGVHPDMILMDLQLPQMDGLQLTSLLKKNPHTQDIIVIALTAYAMQGDELKALSSGCDGYITKPFDTRTLAATVATFFDKS